MLNTSYSISTINKQQQSTTDGEIFETIQMWTEKLMKIMDMVDKDKNVLIQLFKADIPFVSELAVTRLITKHKMKGAEINRLKSEALDEAMLNLSTVKFQAKDALGKIRHKVTQKGKKYIIDYSLDEFVRGRNFGKELIRLGLSKFKKRKKYLIEARVRKNNFQSKKIFQNLDFKYKIKNEFIIFKYV